MNNDLKQDNNMDPLVSFVVPCYNYGRFLPDALDSILRQSLQQWECIIINDGSKDNTGEVAQGYQQKDARFRWYQRDNKGVSSARNFAVEKAQGKYIQFLDADDLLEPDKLKLQVEYMEAHEEVDLIYSAMAGFRVLDDGSREYWPLLVHNKERVSGRGEVLINNLVDDSFFLPGAVLCRRTMYLQVGGFNEQLKGFEDWNFWYRAALNNKSFYFDDREGTKLLVRDHPNNTAKQKHMMLLHRTMARRELMSLLRERLRKEDGVFTKQFLLASLKKHKVLLAKDEVRLNLYYDNVLKGCVATVKHFYYTGKIKALLDGAYLAKERLKRTFK